MLDSYQQSLTHNPYSKSQIIDTIIAYTDSTKPFNKSASELVHDLASNYIGNNYDSIIALNSYQSTSSKFPGVFGAIEDITNYYGNTYDIQPVPCSMHDPESISNLLSFVLFDFWIDKILYTMNPNADMDDEIQDPQEFVKYAKLIESNPNYQFSNGGQLTEYDTIYYEK